MKKLLVFFSVMMVAVVLSLNLTSCGDDPLPAPTVKILAEVDEMDGYTVNITVEATDAATYAWDYGDGNTATVSGNHTHKYEVSGPYTISVTVDNGEGLTASASKNVTIAASIEEIIAGSDENGKTWILSAADLVAISAITTDFAPLYQNMALPSNALVALGLDIEYENEYTFYRNGKMKIDPKSSNAILTAAVFGLVNGVEDVNGWDMNQIIATGMYAGAYTTTNNGTWGVTEDTDLTVSWTANEFGDLSDGDVVYAGADYLTFGNGGFLGVRDFYPNVLIRSISAEKINAVVFLSTSQETPQNPSLAIKVTFVAK